MVLTICITWVGGYQHPRSNPKRSWSITWELRDSWKKAVSYIVYHRTAEEWLIFTTGKKHSIKHVASKFTHPFKERTETNRNRDWNSWNHRRLSRANDTIILPEINQPRYATGPNVCPWLQHVHMYKYIQLIFNMLLFTPQFPAFFKKLICDIRNALLFYSFRKLIIFHLSTLTNN